MFQTILTYLWERRTTVLGYVVTALGIMATSDLFTETQIKWFLLVNGILTAILGHYNNRQNPPQGPVDRQGGSTRVGMLLILALVSAVILFGCAGFPTPRSYSERIASAYAGVAITNDTATILLNADTISKAEASQVLKQTREAMGVIDAARDLGPSVGEDRLALSLVILKSAQDFMCKNRPENPNCQFLTQRVQP